MFYLFQNAILIKAWRAAEDAKATASLEMTRAPNGEFWVCCLKGMTYNEEMHCMGDFENITGAIYKTLESPDLSSLSMCLAAPRLSKKFQSINLYDQEYLFAPLEVWLVPNIS